MKDKVLKDKLDALGFAAFLIMMGVLWLYPEGTLPKDSWLIGFAVIVFGISLIKFISNIKVDLFMILLAFIALAFGLDQYLGFELSFFPIVFILIGVSILFSILIGKEDKGWDCFEWGKKK